MSQALALADLVYGGVSIILFTIIYQRFQVKSYGIVVVSTIKVARCTLFSFVYFHECKELMVTGSVACCLTEAFVLVHTHNSDVVVDFTIDECCV